jgi:SAM-dependent methyltransferase
MSIKGIKCLLMVVALGLAGCASDKTSAEKSQAAKRADSAVDNTTGATAVPKDQKAARSVQIDTATLPAPQAKPTKVPPAVVQTQEPKRPDVIFVPTPPEVVAKMLALAQVTKDDVVYDLGCGDGRIVVAAAKMGCKTFGFDVDPNRIQESKENVASNGVGGLATIEQKDIFTLDLSKANVVTLYLLPSLNVKLIPQLEKLKPGSRIVSHDFDMRGVTPDQVVQVNGDNGYEHTVYLWTTPLKKETQDKAYTSGLKTTEARIEPKAKVKMDGIDKTK